MAVTKIWNIKGRIDTVLNYIENGSKTLNEDYSPEEIEELYRVIDYTTDDEKTLMKTFVTGINCRYDRAKEEMTNTKKKFGKEGGIVAFHAYESFKPGEVTPETAHEIGIKFAQKMWGDRFEVVVSTHLDHEHIHNHFCINSVSFVDGKRYYDNKENYAKMRKISDELCVEYGLSVIDNPQSYSTKSHSEIEAEKKGEFTKNGIFRRDIDECISVSTTMNEFAGEMESRGYSFDFSRKYVTVKHPDFPKPRRLKTLGEDYSEEAIRKRISDNWVRYKFEYEAQDNPEELFFDGNKNSVVVFYNFQTVYTHFVFGLHTVKSRPENNRMLHKMLADEILKLKRFDEEQRLLLENDLYTDEDITEYKEKCTSEMDELIEARRILRNKLKAAVRDNDENEEYELKDSIKTLSQRISILRRNIKVSERLLVDEPVIENKLKEVRDNTDRINVKESNEDGSIRRRSRPGREGYA